MVSMSVDNGDPGPAPSSELGKARAPSSGSEQRPIRVLLAEDNAANRKLAVAMLRELGYIADVATNGIEAVEAVRAFSYDAVLMDCRMPEMDGFRATGEIRRQEVPPSRIPIIAITANAMEGDRQKCLEAGMDDYLSKPVKLESLAAILERWIPSAGPGRKRLLSAARAPAGRRTRQEESPLDEAVMAGLREIEKIRGGMAGLVSVFVGEVEANLERLREAVEQEDVETISSVSHALAGSAANLGASRMAELCRGLKPLVSEGPWEAVGERETAIRNAFDRARAALHAEFPRDGATGS